MGTQSSNAGRRASRSVPVMLLVGTRKGAFIYRSDAARKKWRVEGPHFLGNIVNHLMLDPRDGRTLLLAAKTGHLGPTVFRSRDVGATWEAVNGFNDGLYPKIKDKVGEVPDGSLLHSILVDPRDARHLYIGISTGGTFESSDGAESWRPLNKGVEAYFLPEKNPEYGHDPHLMALHPLKPNRVYQQKHSRKPLIAGQQVFVQENGQESPDRIPRNFQFIFRVSLRLCAPLKGVLKRIFASNLLIPG